MHAINRILIFIMLAIYSNKLHAQEVFGSPPSEFLTSFNFKLLTGGVILLEGRIADKPDTLNFVLDTGSGGISLDSMVVSYLNLPAEKSERTIRGIAGIRNVSFVYNQTLHLPGLSTDSLDFHINDYSILSSAYGLNIDGIIGYSFLSRYIVTIDYDSLKINVYTPGNFKYPKGGFIIRPHLATIPVVNAMVKDDREVASRFYFDTGAGLCLMLSEEFVEDSSLLVKKKKWYNSQVQGLGGKAPMLQGVIRSMKLGPYKFKNIPAYIFEDEYNITAYPYLGGLIGNDLLRRFNIIINYPQRDMYLMPNTHFKDRFDYSYTGLNMYYFDGVIEVGDVMQNSPAEKAGFLPGDVIISIDNLISGTIQEYKNKMQYPGQKVRVVISRNGSLEVLTMKIGNILKRK